MIRFTKLGFLKQVRVKRDQPHWLTDEEGTRIGRPNSKGARITPRPQGILDFPAEGLALSAEEGACRRPAVGPRPET